MHDVVPFGLILALTAVAALAAVGSRAVAERIRVPAPALFLLLAAVAAKVWPELGALRIVTDQRIVTVALVFILFDGGRSIGWTRMRAAAGAVVWIGVAGTLVTAAALGVAAHAAFGFEWRSALLLGTALAPTDPAVVFSVLGGREIAGRTGTLLEGESGANDPVGIALMVSVLGATGGGWSAVGSGVGHFALQLAVGTVAGVLGAAGLRALRRLPMPDDSLRSISAIAFILARYGATAALEGSGFLAVFLAGVLVGDLPRVRVVTHVVGALSALAEIVAFVVLGLSVDLSSVLHGGRLWTGLGLAAVLLVARPLLVGPLLMAVRLRAGERWFVLLAGLKGAVPILLGTYVLVQHAPRAGEIYDVVFVVVLVSVVLQGSLVPTLARRFRVPMSEPE